jgi:hypothetical protein
VLRLEIAEPVQVAHRDGPGVAGAVGDDLAGRDPPLLEVLPDGVILLVQARDLAVAAPAGPPQIDAAVHRHEVALQDVRLVVDLAVGILAEAPPAHGEDHPERQVGAQGEHRRRTSRQGLPIMLPVTTQ